MEEEANDPDFPSAFNSTLEVDQSRAIEVLLQDRGTELEPLEFAPPEPEEPLEE